MKKCTPPKIRNDFMVVAHFEKIELTSIALSYLFQADSYLPIFSFHKVEVAFEKKVSKNDIYALQRKRAEKFSIFLNNAIIENRGCKNLILIGLTEEQKSYLDFIKYYKILEIENIKDIEEYLIEFGGKKVGIFECSLEQISEGLCLALEKNLILKITQINKTIVVSKKNKKDGVVVIENNNNTHLITSINYASSINTDILLVEKMKDEEEKSILQLLEKWSKKDEEALKELKNKIYRRISEFDFDSYEFATFFTNGLPYTLCVSSLPSSQVNLKYMPDFFIFNSIISENKKIFGSAVVFSPIFFKDEETENLIELLEFENFYLRKLIGNGASLYNLKNTIDIYPFDLLHICSHGGEVEGNRCSVDFQDSEKKNHIIVFDHVLSVALTPFIDKHSVESIYYFKSLNGFSWRSDELKAQNYSKELYESIIHNISDAFKDKKVKIIGKRKFVSNTNSIKCSDFNYTGNFDQLCGSEIHPFIFNNTCWSWMTVSTNFFLSGARGYLGTIRDVVNLEAVKFAKIFYDNVFEKNIISAFQRATENFLKNSPEPIYIYWGLHFSTLKNRYAVNFNKQEIKMYLIKSLAIWKEKYILDLGDKELVIGRFKDTKYILKEFQEGKGTGHEPK